MSTESTKHDRRRRRAGSIRSRGRGCWELRVPLPPDPVTGRRRQRSITVHGNRRTAETELRRLTDEAFPSPGSHQGTTIVLARLLDLWWDAKRSTLAASTAREYQRIIDTRLKPDLGAKHLNRLSPFHLDAYYQRLPVRVFARGRSVRSTRCCAARSAKPTAGVGCRPTRPPRPGRRGGANPPSIRHRETKLVVSSRPRPGVDTVRPVRASRRCPRRPPRRVVRAALD
jgi:hypothetical protein